MRGEEGGRAGRGRGTDRKNTDVQISTETSSSPALKSGAEGYLPARILSPITPLVSAPLNLRSSRERGKSMHTPLDGESGRKQLTRQTYANCLTVKFLLQKKKKTNFKIYFFFCNFFLNRENKTHSSGVKGEGLRRQALGRRVTTAPGVCEACLGGTRALPHQHGDGDRRAQ